MAESSEAITGKFDFYDILGYLVPGLVLLGLLVLPFGLIKGIWPSTSFTSAILYLVAAYIVGHVLQGFLRAWEIVPGMRDDPKGKMRAPSAVLLDQRSALTPDVHAKVGRLANQFWKFPKTFNSEDGSWDKVPPYERNAAFLQARNLLLQSGKGSYFEQFQGKYALMGGVTTSLLVTALYYAGWAVAFMLPGCGTGFWWSIGILACLAAFVIYLFRLPMLEVKRKREWETAKAEDKDAVEEKNQKKERTLNNILLLALALGALLGGFVAANFSQEMETNKTSDTQKKASATCAVCCAGNCEGSKESEGFPALPIEHEAIFMWFLAVLASGAAARCYGAYQAFAREFATGVWRDFANFDLLGESSSQGKNDGESKGKK